MKYLNKEWFLFNDEQVYSVKIPTFPINIYMVFFHQTCILGLANIRGWDMSHVKKLPPPQFKAMLGLVPAKPQSKPPPPEPPNKKIKINEGRFVEGSQPSAFSSKMENRPELLTEKPKPRQRKSASDEDIDYDPEEDMCDTEDTLEDIQLEKQTIVENKEKCNYATYM